MVNFVHNFLARRMNTFYHDRRKEGIYSKGIFAAMASKPFGRFGPYALLGDQIT
jgi:hypothetical protein